MAYTLFKMEDFNIDKDLIKADLSVYLDYIKETYTFHSKLNLNCVFASIEDCIYILYYLRFEKQLSYFEIGEKIYPNFKNPHHNAYALYIRIGLNYSTNFEETKEKFIYEQNKLRIIKEKSHSISIDELNLTKVKAEEYYTLLENFKSKVSSTKKHLFIYKLGYKNLEDYFKAFYYFIKVCELSPFQISKLSGFSSSYLNMRIRELGLSLDLKSAQENAVKHNRRNYKNILIAARKTTNKFLSKNVSFGSILENSIRNKFASNISGHIGIQKYEVVVGINNKTIIAPREVDIPIIIVDILKNKVYKFAVEINGDAFHKDDDREENKKKELKNKNWIYYSIWQAGSTKEQKEKYGTVEEQINDISINIKKILQEIKE